jgi:hypothetical protein
VCFFDLSLPPPQPGCPAGDPGPLPVLIRDVTHAVAVASGLIAELHFQVESAILGLVRCFILCDCAAPIFLLRRFLAACERLLTQCCCAQQTTHPH